MTDESPHTPTLDQIGLGLRRRLLSPAQVLELQQLLQQIKTMGCANRIERTLSRNAGVVATQLRDLALRRHTATLDDAALSKLPPAFRNRLITRLANAASRLRVVAQPVETGSVRTPADPAFRCASQHQRCRSQAGGAEFWCHLAFVVCLIRAVLPAIKREPPAA